jgi:ABC-type antimicrobial peptide transport system permease subunit
MNELDLRPRSATEIVDAAFQLYRRAPLQLILAAAIVYVPWLILRLVFDLGVSDQLPSLATLLWIFAGTMVVYSMVGGVVSLLASDVYLGRPLDVAAAFRSAASRFVTLIVTGVIRAFSIGVGMVLLVFPGVYALGAFFAVTQTVVLEQNSVGKSLSRSSALSVGLKGHIIGTLFLIGIIGFAISVGIGLLSGVAQSKVIVNVVSTAVAIVLYPLFGLTETLLYYDSRIRKEGFDVEYLAGRPPSAAAPEQATI